MKLTSYLSQGKCSGYLVPVFNTSWMIGDSKCDIEAGKNIGAKTILISDKNKYDADFSAKNLNEAINLILNEGQIK